MANTYSILAQSNPSATTLTDLYTATNPTIVSTITICNLGTATTFRVSIAEAGAVDASEQYLYYDIPIQAADTFAATLGVTLAATDVIRVYAGSANVAFNLFGTEIV